MLNHNQQKQHTMPPESELTQPESELTLPESELKPPESELMISVKDNLYRARTDDIAGAWENLSIYRIPQILLDNDKKAYIPQTVSLGPYHHGCPQLDGMEHHKWRALHHILKRHYESNNVGDFEGNLDQLIKPYFDVVRDVKDKARAFYEGPIQLDGDDFVWMLLLDSCFVLELFRGTWKGFSSLGYYHNDPIFAFRGAIEFIKRDMIMLQNQIPLFVLDRIHRIEYPGHGACAVARLALRFFSSMMPTRIFDSLEKNNSKGLHCLDVLRRHLVSHVPPQQVPPEQGDVAQVCQQVSPEQGEVKDARNVRQQMIHCVTELKETGIKFKEREFKSNEPVRFWDIDFSNGILKIPRLLVQDGTKSLFLNLMAFEQCHLDCPNHITSYVTFMDNLIDSTADVSYLKEHRIIDNWLGSDAEVADLFNQLCREVLFDDNNCLMSSVSMKVNTYCKKKRHKWRASLMRNYFKNPWSIISLIAAMVLLVLTFTQTLCSLYAS